jgi:serine/threonine protein phosphatase PrpC
LIERSNPYLEPLHESQYKVEDRYVVRAIYKAFNKLDTQYKDFASVGYNIGFPLIARPGACALVGVYYNDKLFFANLGDSQGLIVRKKLEQGTSIDSEEFEDPSNVYQYAEKLICKCTTNTID